MNSDRILAGGLAAALMLLTGCEQDLKSTPNAAAFGEPNRQTMLAQVIDPDPVYEDQAAPTSAEHAGQAVDRYRKDKVKRPDRVRTTGGTSGGN